MVCHYAAYLQTWAQATPEARVNGNRAELRLNFGKKTFVVVFGCRKKNWSLRSLEISRGQQVATFGAGELVKAMAALLGSEPMAPAPRRPIAPAGRGPTPRFANGAPR
jgi:hypothetical protein